MTEPLTCPHCGRPVPESGLRGLCPECMLQAGLGTQPLTGDLPEASDSPSSFPAPEQLAPLFPQLEILQFIGRGGMGAVYRARQPGLNRMVALKILTRERQADPRFAERFEREARALARLSHPNIVTVHDFGQAGDHYYLLMEYVDGLSLRQVLEEHKMRPAEALAIVPRICEALQYAHEQGVVHRDIKPENILIDRQGRVKIADFGIAKLLDEQSGRAHITEDRQPIGTPHYMAPEQVEHPLEVDHRADIYSLGVVFYEMLTGGLPLGKFAPPSSKGVDVRLDQVVLHALEKEPKHRYQQARQVQTDVETIARVPGDAAASGKTGKSTGVEALPPEVVAVKKHLNRASLAVFLLGLVGAGMAIYSAVVSYALPRDVDLLLGRLLGLIGIGSGFFPYIDLDLIRHLTSTLAIVSAWRLRKGRGFNLAHAAIFLSVFQSPVMPLTGLLAIYALAVLWRKEVRSAFAVTEGPGRTGVGDTAEARLAYYLALASAALVSVSFLCLPMFLLGAHDVGFQPGLRSLVFWSVRYLPHWTQGAGLILGWLALLAGWRSGSATRGMAWAVFGAMFPPLCWVASRFAPQEEREWYAVNPRAFDPSLELNLGIVSVAVLLAALVAWGWYGRKTSLVRRGKEQAVSRWIQATCWWVGIVVAGYATALAFNWQSWKSESRSVILFLAAFAGGLTGWLIHRQLARRTATGGGELWRLAKWSGWAVGALAAVLTVCSQLPYQYRRVFLDHINLYLGFTSTAFLYQYEHVHAPAPEGVDVEAFTARTAFGDIALEAIAEPTSKGIFCWLPDGTARCPQTQASPVLKPHNNRELLFCLADAGAKEVGVEDRRAKVNLGSLHYECVVMTPKGERICLEAHSHLDTQIKGIMFRVPADGQTARLRVGIPADTWLDTDAIWARTADVQAWNKRSIRCAGTEWTFSFALMEETPEGLLVNYAGPFKRDAEARLIAVDLDDQVHQNEFWSSEYLPGLVGRTGWFPSRFPGLTLKQLKELRVQIRSFQWVEFQQISLHPGQKTQVTIVHAGQD